MTATISVVINTLDEEANIGGCIHSVKGLADEIVVCDMHSQDRTASIAEQLGARVVSIDRMQGKYQRMRYLAVQTANCEWVLHIDADERLTPAMEIQLRQVADEGRADVAYLGILFWYFGGWVKHGGFYSVRFPRFFRRKVFLESFEEDEFQVHNDWGGLRKVKNAVYLPEDVYLEHLAYPTIEKYVSKTIGMYASQEAAQMHAMGQRFSIWRLVSDPLKSFAGRFVWRQGFRDGIRGLVLAGLYAGYRFATWANLWYLEELGRKGSLASMPVDKVP